MPKINSEDIVYKSFYEKRSKDFPHLTLFTFPLINVTENNDSNYIACFKENAENDNWLNLIDGRLRHNNTHENAIAYVDNGEIKDLIIRNSGLGNNFSQEFIWGNQESNNYTKVYSFGAVEFHGNYDVPVYDGKYLIYPQILYREIFNCLKSAVDNFNAIFSDETLIAYIHLHLPVNSILVNDHYFKTLAELTIPMNGNQIKIEDDFYGLKFIGKANYILSPPLFFVQDSYRNPKILRRNLILGLCEFWHSYGVFPLPECLQYLGDIDEIDSGNFDEGDYIAPDLWNSGWPEE